MRNTSIVTVAMNGQGVVSRRGFLRGLGLGAAGLGAISFTDLLALGADQMRRRQRACILLWMNGGPSQFETFDPKPDHANGGGTPVIETAVPGVQIAEGWERTASVLDELAILRSMTNREGNHQRATYQLHTGYVPSGSVKHPSLGSIAACELGDPAFDLPHLVSIGGPTVGAGLLGAAYEPFVVQNPQRPPDNLAPPVGPERFQRRLALRGRLDEVGFARGGGADRVRDHQELYRQTAGLVLSPRLRAFDLDDEPDTLRDAYGHTPFGQGCLLARRLVEAGVTFVEVRSGGWDTHQQNHPRVARLAGVVDPAFATLITDLKARGLLDATLVVWMGEFGRTPRINANAGRDHYPRAFSVVLGGGGVQGGQVVGATSPNGTEIIDSPVTVNDLLRSICHALGIDPTKENMSPQGRPLKIVEGGRVVAPLFTAS